MKFKLLPTIISLLIIMIMLVLTASNNAAADGVDKLGVPFVFYFKFTGKSTQEDVLRNYFSYTNLIADLIVCLVFISLINFLYTSVFTKTTKHTTA